MLILNCNGKKVPVATLREAAAAWSKVRDSEGLGSSDCRRGCGDVRDEAGKLVGRISYNGRAWNPDGTEAKDDARCGEVKRPARREHLLPLQGITYGAAIRMILGSGAKVRALVLAYFHEDEHGDAGRALDEMVTSGAVAFDGTFYRLQAQRGAS